MLNREQLLTLAVIVSISGISSLYLFSSQHSTFRVDISEIDEGMIGSRVVTQGTVFEVSWLPNTILFSLKEKDHPVQLTVAMDRMTDEPQHERDLKVGAIVEAEGILEEYDGDLNLRVDELGSLSVLQKAQTSFTEIYSLLENPHWYEGLEVKVRGDVVDKIDSTDGTELILSSLDGSRGRYELTCTMRTWGEDNVVGKPAVVRGEWIYENTRGRWVLRASHPPEVKTAG